MMRKSEFTSSSSSGNIGRKVKSAGSLSTNATPPEDQSPPCSSCPFCKSHHHSLENCSCFDKKTVKERKAFVQEARICFGCLRYGHVSRRCRNRKVCKTCRMPHPTILHDERKIAPRMVVKTKQELFSQSKQLAPVQVPVMLLEPLTASQTL